ncbi:hypothetical protein SB749_15090 [Brevibacterium sp. SIMBA_078]|uniref:hypothetical protein n=2 Tax=Bacteria TaxID=2 RepID=UPI00397E05A5
MNVVTTPHEMFPNFYDSFVVKVLADAERWTISGRIGDEDRKGKAPVDARHLIDVGRVRGAFEISPTCLVDLDELTRAIPDAANHAFYLQSSTDGFMVVDIEPDCPEEVALDLFRLPGTLYSEVSMSGRGYHLVIPVPTNLHDFPVAVGKRVLREEHGWYELLFEHWVTFTRRPVPADVLARAESTPDTPRFAAVEDVYAALAAKAKSTAQVCSTTVRTGDDAPAIEGGKQIVERTLDGARSRLKSLDDFGGDHSRWEFSTLGVLNREMRRHMFVVGFLRRTAYSATDETWLLYQAVQEVLPPRPKHSERRNGRPFLLDRAAAMVALNHADGTGWAA